MMTIDEGGNRVAFGMIEGWHGAPEVEERNITPDPDKYVPVMHLYNRIFLLAVILP